MCQHERTTSIYGSDDVWGEPAAFSLGSMGDGPAANAATQGTDIQCVSTGFATTLFVLTAGQRKQHTVCIHVPCIVSYVANSAIQVFQS